MFEPLQIPLELFTSSPLKQRGECPTLRTPGFEIGVEAYFRLRGQNTIAYFFFVIYFLNVYDLEWYIVNFKTKGNALNTHKKLCVFCFCENTIGLPVQLVFTFNKKNMYKLNWNTVKYIVFKYLVYFKVVLGDSSIRFVPNSNHFLLCVFIIHFFNTYFISIHPKAGLPKNIMQIIKHVLKDIKEWTHIKY